LLLLLSSLLCHHYGKQKPVKLIKQVSTHTKKQEI